jgi:hypothetical protein
MFLFVLFSFSDWESLLLFLLFMAILYKYFKKQENLYFLNKNYSKFYHIDKIKVKLLEVKCEWNKIWNAFNFFFLSVSPTHIFLYFSLVTLRLKEQILKNTDIVKQFKLVNHFPLVNAICITQFMHTHTHKYQLFIVHSILCELCKTRNLINLYYRWENWDSNWFIKYLNVIKVKN